MTSNRIYIFTLVELLITISVLAILLSLLLPALNKAKESSLATVCRNNLKQTYLASYSYLNDYDGRIFFPAGGDRFIWHHILLPYLTGNDKATYSAADYECMTCPGFQGVNFDQPWRGSRFWHEWTLNRNLVDYPAGVTTFFMFPFTGKRKIYLFEFWYMQWNGGYNTHWGQPGYGGSDIPDEFHHKHYNHFLWTDGSTSRFVNKALDTESAEWQ